MLRGTFGVRRRAPRPDPLPRRTQGTLTRTYLARARLTSWFAERHDSVPSQRDAEDLDAAERHRHHASRARCSRSRPPVCRVMPNLSRRADIGSSCSTRTDNFKHLARLEGLIPAYVATVAEVVRRREYGAWVETMWVCSADADGVSQLACCRDSLNSWCRPSLRSRRESASGGYGTARTTSASCRGRSEGWATGRTSGYRRWRWV